MKRLLTFFALLALICGSAFAAERPNFVVFIADDLSHFDTEPYGATDIRTPNMQRLAAEGMKFTHCFVASPSCGPSRTALLTGLWPARNGAEPNHKPKRAGVASLPPVLRALGYEVAAFGKVAHNDFAKDHGFDVVGKDSGANSVGKFLAARDAAKPLCLFLGTRHPHVPWSDAAGYDPAALRPPPTHVDTPETRAMRAKYATDVTNADSWLGGLYDLTRRAVKGETLFIFTSDHGSQWPFAKWNLYDAGTRVPFIAAWPGRVKPASVSDAMIQWPDILPTFIELAGGKVPDGLDGKSFAPVLRGERAAHRERVFTTHSGDGGRMNVYPIRSVRTRDWKYIRNLRPDAQHHSHITRAAAGDGLIYWESWQKAGATDAAAAAIVKRHIERPAEELYDLAADPREQRNLAASPDHSERLAALRAEIDAWMREQGDGQTTFGTATLIGEPAPPVTVAKRANAAQKPNVLLIVADDMGYSDAACYGGEIATPHLDALAKDGLRFTQFYNTARCWPSRAAILTGFYAQAVRRDAVPGVKSGAQGTRPAWAPLLPEMLRPLGYRSYHSGKWHVDGKPLDGGFDRSYSLNDHDRHFAPRAHTEDDAPLAPGGSGYYTSTAIADHAIKCLREHAEKHAAQPFFEFLAFTAPHFPLQAPAEDIARYKEKYLRGWDAMRDERWQRMRAMGIGGTVLAPVEREVGPPYAFPAAIAKLGPNEVNRPLAWETLSAEQREFQAAKMAVHAAMVNRMDREIGRVLAQIREMGALENTLVLFLSDNGASAEMMVRGDGHDPAAECGTGATFLSLGPGWSGMANTPFRRHKTWVHEGGIATPLIVTWPRGIAGRGELRKAPGHVIDLVPTILEVAGGKAIPAIHGKSLAPALAADAPVARESLWWQHEGNRALRVGDWKIVASGKESEWELYDLSTDRSETKNLATQMPGKVRELAARWTRETEEYTALAKTGTQPAEAAKPK